MPMIPDSALDLTFFPTTAEGLPDACTGDPGSRPLLLVIPGGGYEHCSERESAPIAQWLNSAGFNAAVLTYPVAPHRHPESILHARSALAALRAGRFGAFDASRIGVIGFSAGGHLAALLSNAPTPAELEVGGPDHPGDIRPDLSILCYPVISFTDLPHEGSFRALLGPDATISDRAALDAERLVDARTPPTLLWHTGADPAVPVTNSLDYARALRLRGVPFDLRIWAEGGHGLALDKGVGPAENWPVVAEDWLHRQGW